MFSPRLTVRGVGRTLSILGGVAGRVRDASPAFDRAADDLFLFQRRWWVTEYGGRRDKTKIAGRDPRFMRESGTLQAAVTRRGAPAQLIDAGPDYLFISVRASLVGLAEIHRRRGREVFGEPGRTEAARIVSHLGKYILTGRA